MLCNFLLNAENSESADYIEVSAVSIPAGLPLLLAGLGGFGVMARRKRAKQAE